MKVAVLSNVNLNSVIRGLGKEIEVFESEGYGNELGILLDEQSGLYKFQPELIFVIEEYMELLGHNLQMEQAAAAVDRWFGAFESSIHKDITYYVSDIYLYGLELLVGQDEQNKAHLENLWQERLAVCREKFNNVLVFPLRTIIEHMGEVQVYSSKFWYMGKIPYSTNMQKALQEDILHKIELFRRPAKKVLLLDLDNTLWGGLAGEHDKSPIQLSEDGVGMAYKNLQRVIKRIKEQGIVLGLVSKNNPEDALSIINNHAHMVLRAEDFAIMKLNWTAKHENIMMIAQELNLGLDSMVFFDDNPAERQLVREMLPQIVVPDFPANAEQLPEAMIAIYQQYFEKPYVTVEDRQKTAQYQANQKRDEMRQSALSFEGYLKNLQIKLIRVEADKNIERLVQLVNKTNQFNLTTMRFTLNEMEKMLEDKNKEIFLYQVTDCFGDNGIVSASILDYGEDARIIEFAMSCRVMGRRIENAIIENMEQAARKRGYERLLGEYIPTEKNKPVADLYSALGYKKLENNTVEGAIYEVSLSDTPKRNYELENGGIML